MIGLCEPYIDGNESKYIMECLTTNWVSSAGAYVDKFEEDFAKFLNISSAVVTENGTTAIETALRILGIGEGDEVIVPSMTFIASVNPIRYVGATPVFVDICRDTWVMDTDKIEQLITLKTKAIIPVHIYGQPVNMDNIKSLAEKYSLFIIEDATESLGSKYKGQHTGTIGDIGCFSFNGNKIITTGAGGMLVSNNKEYMEKAKYLTNQAKTLLSNGAFIHEEVGYNYRMPNVLAAMGVAQLENIEYMISQKLKNAGLYNELLQIVDGITLPSQKDEVLNVNWLYSILIEDNYPITRDELVNVFRENSIQTRAFFYPVHKMKPYLNCWHGDMLVTDDVYSKGINLPSSVGLTKEDIQKICDIIKSKRR